MTEFYEASALNGSSVSAHQGGTRRDRRRHLRDRRSRGTGHRPRPVLPRDVTRPGAQDRAGLRVVQRRALKMRRAGELPYGWITDGTRLRLKPRTWSSAQAALDNTARMYRRDLWIDQGVHVEMWTEKDAIRGVIYPVTAEYDVPLMISRGYRSETFLLRDRRGHQRRG